MAQASLSVIYIYIYGPLSKGHLKGASGHLLQTTVSNQFLATSDGVLIGTPGLCEVAQPHRLPAVCKIRLVGTRLCPHLPNSRYMVHDSG